MKIVGPTNHKVRNYKSPKDSLCSVFLLNYSAIVFGRHSAERSELGIYNEKREERNNWRHDVDQLLAVRSTLGAAYGLHKGDFAIGRYEEIKRMMKQAIADCDVIVGEQKDRPLLKSCDRGAGGLKKKTRGLCEKAKFETG